jgi:hypothetical protein
MHASVIALNGRVCDILMVEIKIKIKIKRHYASRPGAFEVNCIQSVTLA